MKKKNNNKKDIDSYLQKRYNFWRKDIDFRVVEYKHP